ncbi:tyrosine-type recombinase/integrase [Pseudomonas sp. NPDC090964]|uniref:site-specific integrase n=1 Tax=unclassified Pseudomonas TaxID=196821 RepID=UPI000812B68D|nr:site-specific integrase [Pseudomonas sp. 44 R 15]CRM32739.1 tyrosine recombinase XerC [Pseudomonas sp. 44 R 15]
MKLKIRNYKARSGWRFSLLFDEDGDGFPLFYPTAYMTIRSASLMANTQRITLLILKKVYTWASERGIDLEHRFATKALLSTLEIDSLVNALATNTKKNDGSSIKSTKLNYTLKVVADYFGWMFDYHVTNRNEESNKTLIEGFREQLLARKRKTPSKAREKRRRLTKRLDAKAEEVLLRWFEDYEDGNANLSATHFQRGLLFRNILALRTLYDTGMRLGELLSLKYPHFIPARGGDHAYLQIERNHDDKFDRRMNQPVAKTVGRKIPISPALEKMMIIYLDTYRSKIPNVGFTDESFIFVNHKAGQNQGQEIEFSTFRSAFKEILKREPKLIGLHPHLLRHHWNYNFSKHATARGISDEQTRIERELWMGWSAGSESARDYDMRHIQESAFEHGLAIASHTAKNKEDRKQ